MAEVTTEIAKKVEQQVAPTKIAEAAKVEEAETTVIVTPSQMVEGTKKPVEEEVKKTETSSLVGKLEADVEIKASADMFHHMFAGKPHHVSKASPGNIQGCDLHEGDWGKVGSIIYWNYVHGKLMLHILFYIYDQS